MECPPPLRVQKIGGWKGEERGKRGKRVGKGRGRKGGKGVEKRERRRKWRGRKVG